MTCIVSENCIKRKDTDCVEVCPLGCFREALDFLVIAPEEWCGIRDKLHFLER